MRVECSGRGRKFSLSVWNFDDKGKRPVTMTWKNRRIYTREGVDNPYLPSSRFFTACMTRSTGNSGIQHIAPAFLSPEG